MQECQGALLGATPKLATDCPQADLRTVADAATSGGFKVVANAIPWTDLPARNAGTQPSVARIIQDGCHAYSELTQHGIFNLRGDTPGGGFVSITGPGPHTVITTVNSFPAAVSRRRHYNMVVALQDVLVSVYNREYWVTTLTLTPNNIIDEAGIAPFGNTIAHTVPNTGFSDYSSTANAATAEPFAADPSAVPSFNAVVTVQCVSGFVAANATRQIAVSYALRGLWVE